MNNLVGYWKRWLQWAAPASGRRCVDRSDVQCAIRCLTEASDCISSSSPNVHTATSLSISLSFSFFILRSGFYFATSNSSKPRICRNHSMSLCLVGYSCTIWEHFAVRNPNFGFQRTGDSLRHPEHCLLASPVSSRVVRSEPATRICSDLTLDDTHKPSRLRQVRRCIVLRNSSQLHRVITAWLVDR